MKTSIKVFHWLPRIICIAAILFISMFALDAFEPGLTIWQQLGHFLVHLIPTYILVALLLVAWKWEKIGGIIFMLIGLGFSPFIFLVNYQRNHFPFWNCILIVLVINIPFVLVGILFLISSKLKKKNLPKI